MFNITIIEPSTTLLDKFFFQVCLGFQTLTSIDVAPTITSSLARSSHGQAKEYKTTKFMEHIKHLQQQVHDILQKVGAKYKKWHD